MSNKALKRMVLWISVLIYLSVMTGFIGNRYDGILCHRIQISIKDSADALLINSKEVLRLLAKAEVAYLGVPLSKIDLAKVEEAVEADQIVEECRAYTGINGTLLIEIVQREPLVRIIDVRHRNYYIDWEGNVFRTSSHYSPHVLVVNGQIETPFRIGVPVNVNNLKPSKAGQLLKDIYILSKFISDEKLWNAQIEQLYVNKQGEFEMVPRIGPHIIVLGDISDYREKFEKLKIFYTEGLNYVGWNQYKKINLKYKDQVVCTKI
jgi:cell division protein FtsQ